MNLTQSQQGMIDSLAAEFEQMNNARNEKIKSLINVPELLKEKQLLIDYNAESKVINKQLEILREQMIQKDFEKLKPVMEELGIDIQINNPTDSMYRQYKGLSINGMPFEYTFIDYTSVKFFERYTDTRHSHVIISCGYGQRNSSFYRRATTIEALIGFDDFQQFLKQQIKL